MTFQSRIKNVRDALLSVHGMNVYHFERPSAVALPFCVWSEDGAANEFRAGNRLVEQMIHGTIDYYTQTEYDPIVDDIQSAFLRFGISLSLSEIMYEDETALIHYGWDFEV